MSWVAGMIGAAASVAISWYVAARPAKPRTSADGWHLLRPGPLLHCLFLGTLLLLGLFLYILLSGGSTRPDADQQNAALYLLLVGFGAMAVYVGWSTYWTRLRWRGQVLRAATPLKSADYDFSAVVKASRIDALSLMAIHLEDGSRLYFSTWLPGAAALEAEITAWKR